MSDSLLALQKEKELFEHYLERYMSQLSTDLARDGASATVSATALATLVSSMSYSLQKTGGKRFRPLLVFAAGRALGVEIIKLFPFAAAIEMVHAFSLIHDDLPCMDNDDYRRGMPTNHKQFGEATALLAGDALLAEAFSLLAREYSNEPKVFIELTKLLADATGARGMVGGQVIDILVKDFTLESLKKLHSMKTGALIKASIMGAAIIAQAPKEACAQLNVYAECLGLAFQVVDDLHDFDPKNLEGASFPTLIGEKESQELVNELASKGVQAIEGFGEKANNLKILLEFNSKRKI